VEGVLAEREGFEPSIRFCRILTFQASAFDHSATAPQSLIVPRDMNQATTKSPWNEARLGGCGRTCNLVLRGGSGMVCAMRTIALPLALLALTAQAPAQSPAPKSAVLAPGEIVAKAPPADWVEIAVSDMLVMDLVPDRDGAKRRVVIQLIPPPFSQGWVGNIRKLAAAHWWDGTAVTRVQDNYVAQWGDPDAEDKAKARKLPDGLATVPESDYSVMFGYCKQGERCAPDPALYQSGIALKLAGIGKLIGRTDAYGVAPTFANGWPVTLIGGAALVGAPVHCYGMVGVGRDLSPNTGSGAELYTVIGHAPRHLDRNIALVGRVISGIENLSSLPRGTGPLGFYEKPEQRVGITSIRLASELPAAERPRFQYLSTTSASFAKYADARANRRDAFFITPAGGADICNVPVPVRAVK
jgi:peptidylprolyl isomerase